MVYIEIDYTHSLHVQIQILVMIFLRRYSLIQNDRMFRIGHKCHVFVVYKNDRYHLGHEDLLRLVLANPTLGRIVEGLDIRLPLIHLESQDTAIIS